MNEIEIILLTEALGFLEEMPSKARKKMVSILNQVKEGSRDSRIFKKLDGTNIWEFRLEYDSIAYRLLAFWAKNKKSLVVATHGFSKKDQKTPRKEIVKAEAIMKKYNETNR